MNELIEEGVVVAFVVTILSVKPRSWPRMAVMFCRELELTMHVNTNLANLTQEDILNN